MSDDLLIYNHYQDTLNDPEWSKISPFFTGEELASADTGELKVSRQALTRLNQLRKALGAPVIVTSGYRTPNRNRAVGGAEASWHLLGQAFDVSMLNHDPEKFIRLAVEAGFTGIITYPDRNFIHIDTRPEPVRLGKPFPPRPLTRNGAGEASVNRFAPVPDVKPLHEDPVLRTIGAGGVGSLVTAFTTNGAIGLTALVIVVLGIVAYLYIRGKK